MPNVTCKETAAYNMLDTLYRIATNESAIAIQVFDQKKFKKESQGFLGTAAFILGSLVDVNQSAPSTASSL